MNQGFAVALPLLFFAMLDLVIVYNVYKYKNGATDRKIFLIMAAANFIQQLCGTVSYLFDYQILSAPPAVQYVLYLCMFTAMAVTGFEWFMYIRLMLARKQDLSKGVKILLQTPVTVIFWLTAVSPWTHWIFWINEDGVYQRGTLYFLQFICSYIYIALAIAALIFYRKQSTSVYRKKVYGYFIMFILPAVVGSILQIEVFSGGYSMIGMSLAIIFLYLDLYVDEMNEKQRLQLEAQEHIVLDALSASYLNVYVIDIAAQTVKIVKLNGYVTRGLSKEKTGPYPYEATCKTYISNRVYDEDQQMVSDYMSLDNLLRQMKEKSEYEFTYRVPENGGISYYQGKYVLVGEGYIVCGFQNIDEIVKKEKEQKEELQEKLRINAALSQEYTGVFMINCDDGSMKILKLDGNQNAAGMVNTDISYEDFRKSYLLRFALPEYSADVIRLSKLPNLIQYFKDGNKDLLVRYKTTPNQAGQTNFELYVVPFLNGDNNQIIFGCRCIDGIVKQEEQKKAELQSAYDKLEKSNAELEEQYPIMASLASDYTNVFLIDISDGTSKAITLRKDTGDLLGIAKQETHAYQQDVDRYTASSRLYSEDAAVMTENMRLEHVIEELKEKDEFSGNFRITENGTVHYYKFTYRKVFGTRYVLLGFQNIDKLMEDEIRRNMELERQIDTIGGLSNAYTVVCGFNKETKELFAVKKSNALQEFLKESDTVEEAVTRSLPAFVVSEDLSIMRAFIDIETLQERLSDVDSVSIEYRIKFPNERWNRAKWIVANRDENGNAYKFLYVVEDITDSVIERKKQEAELKKARDQAEAANAAKTSFLFNMSHDIRTPMNAIMGFRDLLEKHQDEPEKRQDYLNKIQDASGVLLSIINNVLEMARIEKGTLEIEETAWSTEQFNDTLYSVFNVMMEEKGLTFTRQIVVQHHYVYCDPTKLREIFINILSNAYKYTNAGGSVNMHLEEVPSDREGWVLYQTTISDTGIGMSEEFLPYIFEEFSREQNTTDAKVEGTGLGMPIVKRLVKMLDGTIEVKSKKGEGSTFIVTIPHRIADKANLVDHAGVEIDPKLFEDKRILLAEDNDLNAEIAMEILGEAGFIVERADDGAICMDMLEKAEAGYYDLILMDIQMPNMNGYEATKAIRLLEDHDKANIKILAMTANAFEEDKREALRAGMNGHLAKPINVNELMKMLAGILE